MKKPKRKKCRAKAPGCLIDFFPRSSFQKTCDNIQCALKLVARANEKKRLREQRNEKRLTRLQKESLKTRSQWLKEAQAEFNKFIRERDRDKPCISCGKPPGGNKFGGIWVASHYKSVAAKPELRYNEMNVHKACTKCNSWLSGNIIAYQEGLIERYGKESVDWLDGYHKTFSWTVEDAKEIKELYKQKFKELKSLQG